MELNINSPCYYKNIYGVDDEIYWMCRSITNFVKDKEYSDVVSSIGISPIIAPMELMKCGKWKEETKYAIKSKLIIVKRHIDYDGYVNGSIDEKKLYIIGNILKSMNAVKGKGKINYVQFEADLLEFLGVSKKEMKEYL